MENNEKQNNNKAAVDRLSKQALQKILSGQVKEDSTCFIKFYSNTCHMCHSLRQHYVDAVYEVQDKLRKDGRKDVHFFAFNIADYVEAEKILGFEGVPTIIMVRTSRNQPKITVLQDPTEPHKEMWYHPRDIKSFFNKEI
jgi:hypothetical protein